MIIQIVCLFQYIGLVQKVPLSQMLVTSLDRGICHGKCHHDVLSDILELLGSSTGS